VHTLNQTALLSGQLASVILPIKFVLKLEVCILRGIIVQIANYITLFYLMIPYDRRIHVVPQLSDFNIQYQQSSHVFQILYLLIVATKLYKIA